MIERLEVPMRLNRNAQAVIDAGYDNTGQILIDHATQAMGFADLRDVDVLDVGCGVRFTSTIINRGIALKSYTGIDVSREVIDFLKENVEGKDRRFRFSHWNVRNRLYNPDGIDMATQSTLPVDGCFDVIWLFSVFTHLDPSDSLSLLRLLKKHIRPQGKLLFSAFIDSNADGFEDKIKDQPLMMAFYGESYMKSLIQQSGWHITGFHKSDPTKFIQHHFVCSPVAQLRDPLLL